MHTGAKYVNWLYYFSLALLLVALPLSKYLMSIAEFFLAGVFILDGMKYQEVRTFFSTTSPARIAAQILPRGIAWIFTGIYRKFREFLHRENLPAIVFSSIYLLHILGLIYTVDFNYALKDLRIKFPIFLLPLVFSTTGIIDRRTFRVLMYFYIAAVTLGTFVSTYLFITREVTDIRNVSLFISHIRFSLLIDIAIFISLYLVLKKNEVWSLWVRIMLAAVALWLVAFLFFSASMTGIVILIITATILVAVFFLQKKNFYIRAGIILIIAVTFFFLGRFIVGVANDVYHLEDVDLENLDRMTAAGNLYTHDTANHQIENGHYVWIFLQTDEMKEAWNKRSRLDYDGKDNVGQPLKTTLIRFLSSKGYRKDAEGVKKLTEEEISLVEDGVASIVYVENPAVYVRTYKIIWEYKRYQLTHNPSGHSVTQRIEYWRAAWGIIQDNWLTGTGTGDLDSQYQSQYQKMKSLLGKEYRLRSHNQFLAITVAFGVFGLAWFLFGMFYPPIRLGKFYDYYFMTSFLVIFLSMITEDTIESQAGVTIFAFFMSFHLFAKKFIDVY